jgi:hypothetical protein
VLEAGAASNVRDGVTLIPEAFEQQIDEARNSLLGRSGGAWSRHGLTR